MLLLLLMQFTFAKPNMDKQLEEYNQVELLADLELPLAKILSEMEEMVYIQMFMI